MKIRKKNRPDISEAEKMEICNLYKSTNLNGHEIAKRYNTLPQTINKILRSNNIPFNLKSLNNYLINDSYFAKIDTEDKSYFLGLLYADGCNVEKLHAVHLALQERDKEILHLFNKYTDSTYPISVNKLSEKKPTWQDSHRLQIYSVQMSEDLAKLGCVARKSKILKFPTSDLVPTSLISHFIRGYMDGDGSVGRWKPKNKEYHVIHVNFIGATDFIMGLQSLVKDQINMEMSVRYCSNCQGLSTAELRSYGNCTRFLDWLYEDSTIFMRRKYEKYLEIKEHYLQNIKEKES